ncbi:MAG: hypothetical protein LRY73_10390 [Bacillus sp. (in: Bacteria)]|nr:hypothetical protein [Bacillus sp. (in: firmicutes)]
MMEVGEKKILLLDQQTDLYIESMNAHVLRYHLKRSNFDHEHKMSLCTKQKGNWTD